MASHVLPASFLLLPSQLGQILSGLCSFSVKVLFSDNKLLLSLLFAKLSRWRSQNLSLPGISSSFQSICPGSIFSVLDFSCLFPSFSLLKYQQENDLYYSSNGGPNAPFNGKIPSPYRFVVHTRCPSPRQDTGSSCYLVCFLEPSHLLACCCFLRCDCPSCRYEPYSFALGMELIFGCILMHMVCITNMH